MTNPPEQFLMTLTGSDMALKDTLGSDAGASGTNHAKGLVPDPGAVAGTTKFLREDMTWQTVTVPTSLTAALSFLIDGAGSVITTGLKGYVYFPFACTITSAVLLGDQSGSIVVDIFKCTYTQFDAGSTHPVAGDKITSSTPPTISATTKSKDTTLTSWTVAIAADDVLAFNVNSVTTLQRVTLTLGFTRALS